MPNAAAALAPGTGSEFHYIFCGTHWGGNTPPEHVRRCTARASESHWRNVRVLTAGQRKRSCATEARLEWILMLAFSWMHSHPH